MKQKKILLTALTILCVGLIGLQAQESIISAGGEASGDGGKASYSIGQIVYSSNTGTNGSESQGMQQPYEISVVTGIELTKNINIELKAYPNPTTSFLTLNTMNYETTNLSYQLYDSSGNLIESQKIVGSITQINMAKLTPASYFVKVKQNQNEIKIFKIIKN